MDSNAVETESEPVAQDAVSRSEPEPAVPLVMEPISLVFTGIESTGVEDVLSRAVSEFVQSRISELGVYEVLGPTQIETLLGLEAQRQLMGCESDVSCIVDIAGSLAAERVMSGRLSKVGQTYILTLFLLDAENVRMIGNSDRRVRDEEGIDLLLDRVPRLVWQVASGDSAVTLPEAPEEPVAPSPSYAPAARVQPPAAHARDVGGREATGSDQRSIDARSDYPADEDIEHASASSDPPSSVASSKAPSSSVPQGPGTSSRASASGTADPLLDAPVDRRTRQFIRRDPRSGLFLTLKAEARRLGPDGDVGTEPLYSFTVHGQGGAIGMGMGGLMLAPSHELYRGFGATGGLRVMPFSFRNISPYVGVGGMLVYLPDVEIPPDRTSDDDAPTEEERSAGEANGEGNYRNALRAAGNISVGVQMSWNILAIGLDLSWGFSENELVDEGQRVDDIGVVLGGASFGASVALRF